MVAVQFADLLPFETHLIDYLCKCLLQGLILLGQSDLLLPVALDHGLVGLMLADVVPDLLGLVPLHACSKAFRDSFDHVKHGVPNVLQNLSLLSTLLLDFLREFVEEVIQENLLILKEFPQRFYIASLELSDCFEYFSFNVHIFLPLDVLEYFGAWRSHT